jgi:uncharacterized protein (DUF58 family)
VGIFVFAYQGGLTLILFITMTVLPALSFLILIIHCVSIKVEVKCGETVLRKREPGKLSFKVTNRFLISPPAIKLHGRFQIKSGLNINEGALILSSPACGSVSFSLPFVLPYRGQYMIGCTYFDIQDLLGLFRIKRRVNKIFDIVVIPRESGFLTSGELNEDDSNSTSKASGSFNNAVFSSLREYRSGDTLKQIHWKLSAKQDELISKELEQPLNHSTVIFADFSYDFKDEKAAMEVTDAVIETMLAINKRIVTENNRSENFWCDSRTKMCESFEVSSTEHYSRLLYSLSLLPAESCPGTFSDLVFLFKKEAGLGAASVGEKSIYFILPKLNEDFIEMYRHIGFISRKNVTVITLGGFQTDDSLYEYMRTKTGARMRIIDLDGHEIFLGASLDI